MSITSMTKSEKVAKEIVEYIKSSSLLESYFEKTKYIQQIIEQHYPIQPIRSNISTEGDFFRKKFKDS